MSQTLPEASLDQLFRAARTYNGYHDKPVSTEQLHAIWDLMKYGPTSANMLPARMVWCTTPEAKARLAACVGDGNKEKVLTAPVTVIIGMDLDFHEQLPWLFPHTDAKSWFEGNEALREISAMRNSTLQGAYLIMAARSLGLDVGVMSGFDAAKVNAEFFPDGRWRANFLINLGVADPVGIHPRGPRLAFDEVARIE